MKLFPPQPNNFQDDELRNREEVNFSSFQLKTLLLISGIFFHFQICFILAWTLGSVLIRELWLFRSSLIERLHCIRVILCESIWVGFIVKDEAHDNLFIVSIVVNI